MIQILNLTGKTNGLINLEDKYILTNRFEIADVILIDSIKLNQIEILDKVNVVAFTDKPSEEKINKLSKKGIIVLEAPENDLITNVRNFYNNGNLVGCLNYEDVDFKNKNENVRLTFVTKDLADPLTEIIELMAVCSVPVLKITSKRRNDGFSFTLVETPKQDLGNIFFEGEIGSKIIKYMKH